MRTSPGEVVFGVVPGKNVKLCPRYSGLSSSYLSPIKLIIGVPGKVVYLHYTTVYCAYLSVVLVPFRSCWDLAGWLPCWERASHSALRVCCRKMFCCAFCIVFHTLCLCWTSNLIASIPGPSILIFHILHGRVLKL